MRPFPHCVILSLLLALFAAPGCIAAAVGYTGYALSSSNKEASQKDTEAKHLQTYNAYKSDAEKLNFEREKTGLKPQPVMTFSEWKLAYNIPTPAPEPKSQKSSAPGEEKATSMNTK